MSLPSTLCTYEDHRSPLFPCKDEQGSLGELSDTTYHNLKEYPISTYSKHYILYFRETIQLLQESAKCMPLLDHGHSFEPSFAELR